MSSSTTDSECFICYEKYNDKIDKNKVIECDTCHKKCCFKCFIRMSHPLINTNEIKNYKTIDYHKEKILMSCKCTICKNQIGVNVECLSKPQILYYNKFITYKLINLINILEAKEDKIQMIIEENRKLGECLINKLECTSVNIHSV